jgi:hypothetical protein
MPWTQALNICLILLGGSNPETKCTTLHINLAERTIKKEMLYGFIIATKTTHLITVPIPLN